MFRKQCDYCERKIKKGFVYCPHCGRSVKDGKITPDDLQNWGMIGQDDVVQRNDVKLPSGFESLFNLFLNGFDNSSNKQKKGDLRKGFSISISTAKGKAPRIKLSPMNVEKEASVKNSKPKNNFKKSLKNFTQLPQEEPLTAIRRFSDKVVYEIELPGVKSVEDISIHELENSLEIRAVSKNKSFFKLIPIGLPIVESNFKKGKLILELALEG